MPQLKDVLVVGYGAVGAIYSLVLKQSGFARVSVTARSNFNTVQEQGMHYKSIKYGDKDGWRPDRLLKSVEEAADRPYSYVFLCTKALPDINPNSRLLAPFLTKEYAQRHGQPVYVLIQNGLNVERDLYDSALALGRGEPNIVITALWIGSTLIAPNICQHDDFVRLHAGMYKHNVFEPAHTHEDNAILEDLRQILDAGDSTITIEPEIQCMKFKKNFWNVAFSSYSTLTGHPQPAIFRDPAMDAKVTPNITAILNELLAVGRARGFSAQALPDDVVANCIDSARKLYARPDSRHRPSMLVDSENGRPIEVEVIFGEVVRMAKELRVDVPRIETLYALLTVLQGQLVARK